MLTTKKCDNAAKILDARNANSANWDAHAVVLTRSNVNRPEKSQRLRSPFNGDARQRRQDKLVVVDRRRSERKRQSCARQRDEDSQFQLNILIYKALINHIKTARETLVSDILQISS